MLKYDSDLVGLIYMMDLPTRTQFISFIEDANITCDDNTLKEQIINRTNEITDYEIIRKKAIEFASRGETTIPKNEWCVHESHCCDKHGCKYNDSDCPVILNLASQKYPCEVCNDHNDNNW